MTRKRFCKLVMSKGYNRNYAEGIAETFAVLRANNISVTDGSYDGLWRFFIETHGQGSDAWHELLNRLTKALGIIVDCGFDAVIQTVKSAVDAAIEVLNNLPLENIEALLADFTKDAKENIRNALMEGLKGAGIEDETK